MNGRQIWLLNGALAVLLVWGTLKVHDSWKAFEQNHQVTHVQEKPDTTAGAVAAAGAQQATAADDAWPEIASRNPFSFDRNDIPLVEAKPQVVAGPKPVLFGTMLLGNDRLALMGKAGATSRSGPPVKVGETFEGWKVVKIEDKSVVVTADGAEESLVVGRVPIQRTYEKTATPAPASAPVSSSPVPPPAASPAPAAGANSAPASGWRPGMPAPPGMRVVKNPFGERLEQEER